MGGIIQLYSIVIVQLARGFTLNLGLKPFNLGNLSTQIRLLVDAINPKESSHNAAFRDEFKQDRGLHGS